MGRKLYVGNLAFDVSERELEAAFSAAGACDSVAVITDRATGQSRGFGFVEMSSNSEAQRAIQQLNGTELKGRALTVNEAKEREERGGSRGGGWNRH
ncbi:MAG: RNA-binding protein [Deltaproteobacteria bacterium]|nr:RNA-binding protein [Deltaproteobacteria bacterium]